MQVVISTPEPTAVLDMYKFVKLAATRRVIAELGSRENGSDELLGEDFRTLEQVFAAASIQGPEIERRARDVLAGFHPSLLLNCAGGERGGAAKVGAVMKRFLGSEADVLGQIPVDPAVGASIRRFLPVCEAVPNSPAALAFKEVEGALRRRLSLPAANGGGHKR
ncbi:MAG TPA: hypothetical protein VHZ95_10750 [Polyangiales bacterium]|nr:hypothetical protein [Polyangiales bacterium]